MLSKDAAEQIRNKISTAFPNAKVKTVKPQPNGECESVKFTVKKLQRQQVSKVGEETDKNFSRSLNAVAIISMDARCDVQVKRSGFGLVIIYN